MPYLVEPQTGEVTEIQPSTFQELGLKERQDLEEWVIRNPAILGEPLLVITSEYEGFDQTQERLDVLAIDKQGKLVVVELKTDDSGPTVELQAIKYAAYCSTLRISDVVEMLRDFEENRGAELGAEEAEERIRAFVDNEEFEDLDSVPRIILAAKRFRPEVTSSVLWLTNSFEGLDISCVRLDLIRVDDKLVLVPNVIVPLPEAKDFEVRRRQKEADATKTSALNRRDQQFFSKLLESFRDTTQRKALPQSWLNLPSGKSGIEFAWAFRGRPRSMFSVALEFKTASPEDNRKGMEAIQERAREFRELIGEELEFTYPFGRNGARIISTFQSAASEELEDWAVKTMRKYITHFSPLL